jgi:SAM-dependent methyltransferase
MLSIDKSHCEQLQSLLCASCGMSEWDSDQSGTMRCRRCRKGFPLYHNIVDLSAEEQHSTWDDHYKQTADAYDADSDWWTLTLWRQELFNPAYVDFTGKTIVDFGCGTSARVANLIPAKQREFRYFGVDASMPALRNAAANIPNGFFLRAPVDVVRFHSHSADLIFSLGILMYFDDPLTLLNQMLGTLKPGGVLLLHEQLKRRSWGTTLKLGDNSLPAFGIQRKSFVRWLAERGDIVHTHQAGSPLRRPLRDLNRKLGWKFLRPIAVWIDDFWCATIGKLFPALGAGEIQIVFRKAE